MQRKIILLVLIIAGFSSCTVFLKVNCSDCHTDKPDSADIKMYFTINAENQKVPFEVYRGKVEDGNVEWVDTTNNETVYLYVKMDQFYSVVAKYKSGSRTINAVDGQKISTRFSTDDCNEDCYIVINNELDIRLKE
jgi:hypothetical protein